MEESEKERDIDEKLLITLDESQKIDDKEWDRIRKYLNKYMENGCVFITNSDDNWKIIRIYIPHQSDFWGDDGTYKVEFE